MPAEVEEVVVDADALDAEDVGADLARGALSSGVRGRDVLAGGLGEVGRGERLAIELAVGGERQRVEDDEGARDHVVGQRGA